MANIQSAIKRARQNKKRRAYNHYYSKTVRTYIKQAQEKMGEEDAEAADLAIRQAVKALDKAAQKGIIHRNNAARRKSRLVKAYNKATAAE